MFGHALETLQEIFSCPYAQPTLKGKFSLPTPYPTFLGRGPTAHVMPMHVRSAQPTMWGALHSKLFAATKYRLTAILSFTRIVFGSPLPTLADSGRYPATSQIRTPGDVSFVSSEPIWCGVEVGRNALWMAFMSSAFLQLDFRPACYRSVSCCFLFVLQNRRMVD
jgi:hypothetical protein